MVSNEDDVFHALDPLVVARLLTIFEGGGGGGRPTPGGGGGGGAGFGKF